MGEPEEPNDLGAAIKRLRGPRPQSEVAEAAGMTPSSWSDYERGKQRPRPPQLERIAKALGCTLKELDQEVLKVGNERLAAEARLNGAGEPPETSDLLLENTDRELQEIDQSLDNLLARKKLLLAFRRYLVGLPPGTLMPPG
jgi:transcriptional regulator with XRE-family HTH domain